MNGILYIATGKRCCNEAIESAQRCRRFDPSLPITIQTDLSDMHELFDIFDSVVTFTSPSYSYRDKVVGLSRLPYDHTLFLDSDACLISSADDMFDILQRSDLAASHAPVRLPPGWFDPNVPTSFPELNTGVLLIRRSRVVENLTADWLDLYDYLQRAHGQAWDQASFRSVLWSSLINQRLRFLHLPPEANLRTTKPWFAGRGMPVQVVHGRFLPSEFDSFVSFLNDDVDCFRTWDQWVTLYPETSIRPRFDRTFG